LAPDLIDGLLTASVPSLRGEASARRVPWVLNPLSTRTDRELPLPIVQIEITPSRLFGMTSSFDEFTMAALRNLTSSKRF
jgi:hypothetical protein